MNIQKTILSLLFVLALQPCIGQSTQVTENSTTYPKAEVSYNDFKELVLEVETACFWPKEDLSLSPLTSLPTLISTATVTATSTNWMNS